MGWTVQGLNPGKGKRFLSSSNTSRPTLGPTQPPIRWMLVFFPRVKQLGREVNNSRTSSVKAKNEWRCTCSPPICLHGVDRETLPLPLLSRHHQPYKPLNQGCYCYYYYYYRCINFSAVEADEVKLCTVVLTPTQILGAHHDMLHNFVQWSLPQLRYWGPIMTCCTTLYGNEVT